MGATEHPPAIYLVPIVTIPIILFVVSSGCVELTSAYVADTVLTDGWYENISLRNTGSQFFGLEKWASATYELNGQYPASLTVTTMKTLVLMDEQELQNKIEETMQSTLKQGIQLNESVNITGERVVLKGHKTRYMVYDGIDTTTEPFEKIKIIGEVWNCAVSGTSVVCIGMAYITNSTDNSSSDHLDNWEKIVMDSIGTIDGSTGENGLIYNVICH